MIGILLLAQEVATQVPVVMQENNGRRDVLLAIIATIGTVVVTLGPILINRWMDKLKDERLLAAATLKEEREAAEETNARERAAVAAAVADVKVAAHDTVDGISQLQATVDETKETVVKTHAIANSRYDEIRNELKLSNENNQRITKILMSAGILAPTPPPSGIVAEPAAPAVENAARRAEDLALLKRRATDKLEEIPPNPRPVSEPPTAEEVETQAEDSLHPETDPAIARELSEGLAKIPEDSDKP